MLQGSAAKSGDLVELVFRREVLEPGSLSEAAALRTGGEVRLDEFGQAGDIFLRDAKEEAIPVDPRWQKVVVRDEHGGDAGTHHLEQPDTAGACASWAEDEMRGGERAGVVLLTIFASGLVEVPVVIGAGVLDQDVGTTEAEIEEALAKQRGAAALEGEEQRLLRGDSGGANEGVRELAAARDVGVAEGATGAAVFVDLGGAVHTGNKREVVVIFRVDGATIGVTEVKRVA